MHSQQENLFSKWRGKKELEDFDIWFKIINKFCRVTWFHIPCYTNMILILLLHLFLLQMLDFILEFYNTRLFVLELLNHVAEAILKQISCTYILNPSHVQVKFKQMIYRNYIYHEFAPSIGIDVTTFPHSFTRTTSIKTNSEDWL